MIMTNGYWPYTGSVWASLEDLSLLCQLSSLMADLSPQMCVKARKGPNSPGPSIVVLMAQIPGCNSVELGTIKQLREKEYRIERVRPRDSALRALKSPKPRTTAALKKGDRGVKLKLLAHGRRERTASVEPYSDRTLLEVGNELYGTTDLAQLEGSVLSQARRQGRYIRLHKTKRGHISFRCASGAACPFLIQFRAPSVATRRVQWTCTNVVADHTCQTAEMAIPKLLPAIAFDSDRPTPKPKKDKNSRRATIIEEDELESVQMDVDELRTERGNNDDVSHRSRTTSMLPPPRRSLAPEPGAASPKTSATPSPDPRSRSTSVATRPRGGRETTIDTIEYLGTPAPMINRPSTPRTPTSTLSSSSSVGAPSPLTKSARRRSMRKDRRVSVEPDELSAGMVKTTTIELKRTETFTSPDGRSATVTVCGNLDGYWVARP